MAILKEATALKKGYRSTGIAERRLHDIHPRLDKIRKAGFKAVLVSWNGGGGYSVYTEPKYHYSESIKNIQMCLGNIPYRKQVLIAELKQNLSELKTEEENLRKSLSDFREKLAATT